MTEPETAIIPPDAPDPTRPPSPFKGLDVLLITVFAGCVLLAGSAGLAYLSGRADPEAAPRLPLIYLSSLSALLEVIALLSAVYLLGLRRRGLGWQSVGFLPIAPKWLGYSFLAGLVVIPLSSIVALVVQLALGETLENTQLELIAPDGFSWFGMLSMLLLVGVLVPVAEEVYFRGVVFQALRSRWSLAISLLVSSLYFGVVHVQPGLVAAAIAIGLIMGWFYARSQSLYSAILIHMMNNASKVLLLYIALALGVQV